MAFEIKENTGSLFVNDKDGVKTRPDRKGSAKIGGLEYWVSGWIKDGKKGKWLSLSFTAKDQDKLRKAAGGQEAVAEEMNDEIPF